MKKLLILIYKDFLLLWRDKINLVILFLMPMFFIFAITLLQAQHSDDSKTIQILLINNDINSLQLPSNLLNNTNFIVKTINPKSNQSLFWAKTQVAKGYDKLLVIIPTNMGQLLTASTQQQIVGAHTSSTLPNIQLFFDPAINPTLKNIIIQQIAAAIRNYQMQTLTEIISEVLGTASINISQLPLPLQIQYAGAKSSIEPNAVQQNVPAWSLFGMFFIALPLASIMIKEREQAVLLRFYMTPISRFSLIFSRFIAFIIINFLQLCLMFFIGIVILPLFNLPALNLWSHFGTVSIIGLCSACAATSFGLFIGTWTKTIEQASALVPILIVLAAAIGGIMIPIYLMPTSMQIFALFSPLHWGLEAFIDVLVRNSNLQQISWPLMKLILFSAACYLLAWWKLN